MKKKHKHHIEKIFNEPIIQNGTTRKLSHSELVFKLKACLNNQKKIATKFEELYQDRQRLKYAGKASTHAKEMLLANINHEFRTPLNGIIGFTQLLYNEKLGSLSAKQKESLGIVLVNAKHLVELVNNLIGLARSDTALVKFYPQLTNLRDLTDDVSTILIPMLNKNKIKLVVNIHPAIRNVILDAAKLKKVLYNYLSNAIKFTSKKNGLIEINFSPELKGQLRLEVRDNGIGIKKNDTHKLFTAFKQINDGYSKRYQGLGIGLAYTKRIVEAQGGYVGVESSPQQGSIFFAVMPYTLRHYAKRVGTTSTILIVENDYTEQSLIVRNLINKGYSVDVASTGREALKNIKKFTYQAITVSLLLPDIGGWELLHKIRTKGLNQSTPILVLMVAEKKIASLGFTQDYLTKPVKGTKLLDALEKARVFSGKAIRKILFMDEDIKMSSSLKPSFKTKGYKIIHADNTREGLRTIKFEKPDVVVLEILQQKVNCFDVFKKLRQINSKIHVILWSKKSLTAGNYIKLREISKELVIEEKDLFSDLHKELRRLNIK